MINLGISRTISKLKCRYNLILFGNGTNLSQSLRNDVNIQIQRRAGSTKQGTYSKKSSQFYSAYNDSIQLSGYLMLGIPISTFILGVWQVQRYSWKKDLIEKVSLRLTSEPTELPDNLDELASKEYCPVRLKGKFLHNLEFSAGLRSYVSPFNKSDKEELGLIASNSSAPSGFHIITPFKLEDKDLTILVNRGWVPSKHKDPKKRNEEYTDDTVEITGIVRLPESRPVFVPNNVPENGFWFYRDIDAMAKWTGAAPVYVEQTYEPNQSPNAPIGGQTRATFRTDHVTYALTWFTLCAITSYLWYQRYLKKKRII